MVVLVLNGSENKTEKSFHKETQTSCALAAWSQRRIWKCWDVWVLLMTPLSPLAETQSMCMEECVGMVLHTVKYKAIQFCIEIASTKYTICWELHKCNCTQCSSIYINVYIKHSTYIVHTCMHCTAKWANIRTFNIWLHQLLSFIYLVTFKKQFLGKNTHVSKYIQLCICTCTYIYSPNVVAQAFPCQMQQLTSA